MRWFILFVWDSSILRLHLQIIRIRNRILFVWESCIHLQIIWISIRIHVSFNAPPPNDLLSRSQPVHFAGERNCLQQKIVVNHVAKFHYRNYHFHLVLNNARKKKLFRCEKFKQRVVQIACKGRGNVCNTN